MTCSQHNPAEQTTLAYDDTKSFGLPHFSKRDYKGLTSSRFEVIPFLIEDYSLNKRSYIYTAKGRFKKGGNRLCTELYHQLRAIKFSGTRAAYARKVVMIADNASENKNMTLLAFDHDLVYHGWYDEVIRLYGPVGHTHNGIDGNHQIHNEVLGLFVSGTLVHLVAHYPQAWRTTQTRVTKLLPPCTTAIYHEKDAQGGNFKLTTMLP